MRRSGVRIPLPPKPQAWSKIHISGFTMGCTRRERSPLPPVYARSGSGERGLLRRSSCEGGRFLPCHIAAASFDSACHLRKCQVLHTCIFCKARPIRPASTLVARAIFAKDSLAITTVKCRTPQNGSRGYQKLHRFFGQRAALRVSKVISSLLRGAPFRKKRL
jgi:hypothetical protein